MLVVINHRRACAARATVLGGLSVCLSKSHLTSRTSNRAINEHAYFVAYGDLPETTAFKSYAAKHERKSQLLIYPLTRGQLSPLDAQRNVRGYPGIVNDIQPFPKRCLLMLLARPGARTGQHHAYVQLQRGAWLISAHAYWHMCSSMRGGFCTLVFFILKLDER